jgi:hypothetical protein
MIFETPGNLRDSLITFKERYSRYNSRRGVNVVNGFGLEAGKPLATGDRIAKIGLIIQYASQNLIPVINSNMKTCTLCLACQHTECQYEVDARFLTIDIIKLISIPGIG